MFSIYMYKLPPNTYQSDFLQWMEYVDNNDSLEASKFMLMSTLMNDHVRLIKYINRYRNKKVKNNKLYMYMITFTLGNKINIKSEMKLKEIENYIILRLRKKGLRIIRSALVREGTVVDGKRPHWHAAVICKTSLKRFYFTTYLRDYGNISIDISRNNDYDEILKYINKTHKSVSIISDSLTLPITL